MSLHWNAAGTVREIERHSMVDRHVAPHGQVGQAELSSSRSPVAPAGYGVLGVSDCEECFVVRGVVTAFPEQDRHGSSIDHIANPHESMLHGRRGRNRVTGPFKDPISAD